MSGDGEQHDPLARIVALAIVLATLATAFVAYRAAVASRSDDRAAADAHRLSVLATNRGIRGQQEAQLELETFSLLERQRRRAASAGREALFRPASERTKFELERARWERVARRTQQLTSITADGPDGPERDEGFPDRLLIRQNRAAVEATALQDAANEESVAWDARGSTYASILTVFAVSLFLLGFALSVPGGARLVFVGTGIVLALVGSFRAVRLETMRPERAPDTAARAYADGEVARLTGEPDEAVERYSEAIELRPSFARAYLQRGRAEFVAGSAGVGGRFISTTSDEALERSIADTLKARELGLESHEILADLGAQEFLLGLFRNDDGLLEDAAQHAREAIELGPDIAIIRSNLAVALLARGKFDEATVALESYLRHALFRNGDQGTPRDPAAVKDLIAGTLSDLAHIVTYRRSLANQVIEAKELVVGSASLGRVGQGAWEGSIGIPRAKAFTNLFQIGYLPLSGFEFGRDVLWLQWYKRVSAKRMLDGIPNVSGVVETAAGPGTGELGIERAARGSYYVQRNYGGCVPPGEYFAEFYVNGQLRMNATAKTDFGRLDLLKLRTVDFSVCAPAGWRRDRRRNLPGLYEGVVSPDRSRGASIVRIASGERLFGGPLRSRVPQLMDRVLARFSPVAPRRLRFDKRIDNYFAGLGSARSRWYAYPGGRAIVGAGIEENGDLVVGVVYGPTTYWEGGEPSRIFDSFTVIV
jgi:tetratricopeptide (TPR) repeat protein